MSDDMVERLRDCSIFGAEGAGRLCGEAADLIETQAREIERLREALELADCALRGANMNMDVIERKVRAALGESHD